MQQSEFNLLIKHIKKESNSNILYNECYEIINNGKVLLHDLGLFETTNVSKNLADKIAMKNLHIQNHNFIALDVLSERLASLLENMVRQFIISGPTYSFLIISDQNLDKVIGIAKKTDFNIEKDLNYQIEMKKHGYPNKNIWWVKSGILIGNV